MRRKSANFTPMSKLSIILPAIVAVLYLATSLSHLYNGKVAWSFVWLCYAMANIGLIFAGETK